jgi:F0F1-type ATP synthase assembly protein I
MPEHDLPDPPEWDWRKEYEEQGKEPPDAKATKKSPSPAVVNRNIGLAIAIGYSFVGPVLGFMLLGMMLDGWKSGGWTIVGLLVGMVAALALLLRLVGKLNRDD